MIFCLPLKLARSCALLLLWLGFGAGLCAHTLPISYLAVVPDSDYLHLELTLNPFELSFFSELDKDHDGQINPAELEAQQTNATRRILECLTVRVAGKPVTAEVAGISPDIGSHHITLRAQYPVDARHSALTIESNLATITSGSHLTQVTCSRTGRRQLAQLDMQSPAVTFAPFEAAQASAPPAVAASGRLGGSCAFCLALGLPGLLLAVARWRKGQLMPSAESASR